MFRLLKSINKKIILLNSLGVPVVLLVTGNNAAGKTRISKALFRELNLYHHINLGIISKMIRYFRPELTPDSLENFGEQANQTFLELINLIIEHYFTVGVNIVIEGVQINPRDYVTNPKVLGGIILDAADETLVQRGRFPETHFKREINYNELHREVYEENEKFKKLNNNKTIEDTLEAALEHINILLDKAIAEHSKEKPLKPKRKYIKALTSLATFLGGIHF